MNMDIKAVVDIEAFTKGMSFTLLNTGTLIPAAVVGLIQNKVAPMVPSPEYTAPLVNAFFDTWKLGIVLLK